VKSEEVLEKMGIKEDIVKRWGFRRGRRRLKKGVFGGF